MRKYGTYKLVIVQISLISNLGLLLNIVYLGNFSVYIQNFQVGRNFWEKVLLALGDYFHI